MAFYHRNDERKRLPHDFRRREEEVVDSLCRLGNRPVSPRSLLEQEKRIRREIANSNERRRMQSINAGFQSLRTLLPRREGENLSKAAILQNTADYIYSLEQENARLLEQNSQLKRRVLNIPSNHDSDGSCSDSPLPKRKKHGSDSADEGISIPSPRYDIGADDLKRNLVELKLSLEQERGLRMNLEDQIKNLKSQLLSGKCSETNLAGNECENYTNVLESIKKETPTATDMVLNNDLNAPVTYNSSADCDSSYQMSVRDTNSNVLINVPIAFTKNATVLLPCVGETSIPVVTSNVISLAPITLGAVPAVTESDSVLPSKSYKHCSSRPNLETIVEAIRHVEGDHVFQDDPSPTLSSIVQCSDESVVYPDADEQTNTRVLNNEYRQQVIQSTPTLQPSRPGVIVVNRT
ncbi:transcription factor AP-4-like [Uloborus diversus]|uniref:transcription factor AP-4-like n=1 Tax=Uloborus diversus TaxID=327109 RepID=UPI00240A13B5|nr:transcription factor AP-4-like [Uloborus diversus]